MDELFAFDDEQVARIAAAVRAYEGQNGKRPALTSALPDRNYSRISFYNDSGETIPAFGAMRTLDTSEDDDGFVFLKCKKPDGTLRRLYLVNGTEDVPNKGYSCGTWLWHSGRVLFDDSGSDPVEDSEWGVKSGEWKLFQDRPGFLIKGGVNSDATTVIAVQQLGSSILGKPATAISAAGSGTVHVYGGTPGSEADTGLTIPSCYNRSPTISIETSDFVQVGWLHGKPYVAKFC